MFAAKLTPVIVAIGLAAGACSGSRPHLEPTGSSTPTSTSTPTTTVSVESTTSVAVTTTSRAIQFETTTTIGSATTTEYPSVGPLETVPPDVYPTTG